MKNPKIKLTAASAVFFAAGVAVAMFFGQMNTTSAVHKAYSLIQQATPSEANAALAYMGKHLPNTHFKGASVYKTAPGLIHLSTDRPNSPVYFDPLRKYLIIGLVINLSPNAPAQHVASGTAAVPPVPSAAGPAVQVAPKAKGGN